MSRIVKPAGTKWNQIRLVAAAVASCGFATSAVAQTSFGSGVEVVLPLAAHVAVYHSQVFIRNPNPDPMTLNVRYYQSNNGTAPAGLRPCAQVILPGNQSTNFDLGAQCSLNSIDDDFGMLILEDAAQTSSFF
ncbi:MAG: hypothetical protein ABW318_19100, partial [Vicinamibacterales bacterium]